MPTKDLCLNCKHYWGALACAAFPDRIPDDILTGDNDHDAIFPGQVGAFVFEEIDLNSPTSELPVPFKEPSPAAKS